MKREKKKIPSTLTIWLIVEKYKFWHWFECDQKKKIEKENVKTKIYIRLTRRRTECNDADYKYNKSIMHYDLSNGSQKICETLFRLVNNANMMYVYLIKKKKKTNF